MHRKLTLIDLFAGVGGFTLGFLKANERASKFEFEPRLLVDLDPTAAYTFKKNYPRVPYWPADLNKVSGDDILRLSRLHQGELDFLIGGPPCQGFSPNGKRWLEDNRNKLMARFIELAQQLRPKIIIIENVPTALSAWEKLFNEQIHEAIPTYTVKISVLNASEFGVPQIRRRAFIVGVRADLGIEGFTFPHGDYSAIDIGNDSHCEAKADLRFITVEEAIGDLPSLNAGQDMDGSPYTIAPFCEYQRARRTDAIVIFNHKARSHSPKFQSKISVIKPGEGNAHLPNEQRFSDNYFSQAYARLHAKGIGFTVTAHFRNPGSGRFTHYRDNRSITVREAARLQSFDDKFIFHGWETDQERHVGNAVPPLLAEALAQHFANLACNLI